jgi:hypothetical protein
VRITRDKEIEMGKSKGIGNVLASLKRDRPNQVCIAELMNPDEVESQLHRCQNGDEDALRGRWLLNGVVSDKFFKVLERTSPSKIAGEFIYTVTDIGADYGQIVTQVGSAQHRFLMPLYSARVRDFFATSSVSELNIFYENHSEEGFGLNYECAISNDEFADVERRLRRVGFDQLVPFLAELADVISHFGRPSSVASLFGGVAVKSVDLSVLLPFEDMTALLGFTALDVASLKQLN